MVLYDPDGAEHRCKLNPSWTVGQFLVENKLEFMALSVNGNVKEDSLSCNLASLSGASLKFRTSDPSSHIWTR